MEAKEGRGGERKREGEEERARREGERETETQRDFLSHKENPSVALDVHHNVVLSSREHFQHSRESWSLVSVMLPKQHSLCHTQELDIQAWAAALP